LRHEAHSSTDKSAGPLRRRNPAQSNGKYQKISAEYDRPVQNCTISALKSTRPPDSQPTQTGSPPRKRNLPSAGSRRIRTAFCRGIRPPCHLKGAPSERATFARSVQESTIQNKRQVLEELQKQGESEIQIQNLRDGLAAKQEHLATELAPKQ
jgi:hypothetical protein